MTIIVGLSIVAVVSAALFGYLLRLLLFFGEKISSSDIKDDITEFEILRWVARQSVADLVNRRQDVMRVTMADVKATANSQVSGAFICIVDTPEWEAAVCKVQVRRSSSVRFSASINFSKNNRTVFYNRTYELEVIGLEEKISIV